MELSCTNEGFRVFAKKSENVIIPALREQIQVQEQQTITVYTDGSCINNGSEDATAGSGIWYGDEDNRNKAFRVSGPVQSNQTGELMAVLEAIKQTPEYIPLLIKSDSEYMIKGLTVHLANWEDKGWLGVTNKEIFKTITAWMRCRASPTMIQWVKGHNNEKGNDEADRLAGLGALIPQDDELDLSVPEGFNLQGAKLSAMKQSDLYKGIRSERKRAERRKTTINLDKERWAIKELNGTLLFDERI